MDGATVLLRHAHDLVERGWTQHADARAGDNSSIHPCDGRATKWSLLGALVCAVERSAAADGELTAVKHLARACIVLADRLDTDSLEQWNDAPGRTQGDVLAALDHAAG